MADMEFTKQQIIDYVQRAIHCASGDDLERARVAFRGRSPEEMEEQWGESGMTCQQILDGYARERALATVAMKWVVNHL